MKRSVGLIEIDAGAVTSAIDVYCSVLTGQSRARSMPFGCPSVAAWWPGSGNDTGIITWH